MTIEASIFRGRSAFPLTLANADGVVDTDAFAIMIDRLVSAGVYSIAVLGSTGTYAYLDRSERSRALACAVETVAGRVPLIASIAAARTSWVKELARDAERRGADGLLLAPVSYAPLTQDEVFMHFEATAAATGLPICIYNNPSTTHFSFSLDLVSRLSHVPRIAAIKMLLPVDGDFSREIGQLRTSCREGLIVGYSGDWGAAPALLAGADASYSVFAGLLAVPALRLPHAALSGDREIGRSPPRPMPPSVRSGPCFRLTAACGSCTSLPISSGCDPCSRPCQFSHWPPLAIQRTSEILGEWLELRKSFGGLSTLGRHCWNMTVKRSFARAPC